MNREFQITSKLLKAIPLITLLTISVQSTATVGGGERIEFLGYDAVDNKVFVLRHYDDARGRLPQLYYYDLGATTPQQLIEVRSIYINPETSQYDEFDDDNRYFNARLTHIKQRLTALESDFRTTNIEVKNLTQRKTDLTSWFGDIDYVTEYNFTYRVLNDANNDSQYASQDQTVTTYSVCLNSDYHLYHIPNQPYALTKVSYLGTLMEGGYTYEDPVLMHRID